MKKSALITGINGQDGSYLAEHLLDKGYEVHGILRRHSVPENQSYRLNRIYDRIKYNLYHGDMLDPGSLVRAFNKAKPDEIYNLAAQSHVKVSFDQPDYTIKTIVQGTLNLLEIIRGCNREVRMYQAGSSEMFGNSPGTHCSEYTPMYPVSPYGCAKLCAHNLAKLYRGSYGIWVTNGILFNHESPRRAETFVTNKIIRGAVKIKYGLEEGPLRLGNPNAQRDWGHAYDYVRVMHLLLQLDNPDDFVCATGETRTVRELANYVFGQLNIPLDNNILWNCPEFLRPNELHRLKGDSSKLHYTIKYSPKYTFETMIEEMIDNAENEYDY